MKEPDLLLTAAFIVISLLGLGYALTILLLNLL
jgi:hypothetical protein